MKVDDGGRLVRGPAPLTLFDPMVPTEAPEPGAAEADWVAGLLARREGGVDIWLCYKGQDMKRSVCYLKLMVNYAQHFMYFTHHVMCEKYNTKLLFLQVLFKF